MVEVLTRDRILIGDSHGVTPSRIGGTDTQHPIACFYFSGLNIITSNRELFSVLLHDSERLSATINAVLGNEPFAFGLGCVRRNGFTVKEDSVAENAAIQLVGMDHHPSLTMGAYQFVNDFGHPTIGGRYAAFGGSPLAP